MNPEPLIQNLTRISGAPKAIPRIRELILDLAMRGMLVEQRPSAESAADLLRSLKDKSAADRLAQPTESDFPFEIPDSWAWVRLADVGRVVGGSTPPSTEQDCFTAGGSGMAWLTPADMGKISGPTISHGSRDLTQKGMKLCSAQVMPPGSVLFTSRAPIGYVAIAANSVATNQGFKSVVPYCMDMSDYIALYFRAFARWIDDRASGTTFREVSGKAVAGLPFPLPPLDEQKRIVGRVTELMALCDQLERAQAQRETLNSQLVSALLTRIRGGDPDLDKNVDLFFDQFSRVSSRPEYVSRLQQCILELAIQGRLTRRDTADEPVAKFLERVALHAKRGDKSPLGKDVGDRALPPGWVWVRFGDITVCRDGERVPVSREERSLRQKVYDYYGASGVIDKIDGFLFDKPLLLIGEDGANLVNRSTPIAFMARGKYWVNNHAHVIDGVSDGLLRYLEVYINAIDLKPYVTGTAQPKMNQAKLNSIPIALPPEAEQLRIVAMVEQITRLCEKTRSTIQAKDVRAARLLESACQQVFLG